MPFCSRPHAPSPLSRLRRRALACAALGLCLAAHAPAHADTSDAESNAEESANLHGQATYVRQFKPAFTSPYAAAHSLAGEREASYSFTTTAFIGWRPWDGGELYFNPEVSQGRPLSGLNGLGGFTNGEMARSSGPHPTLYRARLFLRQTWGTGGGREARESGPNQLAGAVDRDRWVLTAGNLSVTDIFDNNAYNHDPRTQFMNWSLLTHGAYDFAADARGYTWGVALERYWGDWALRAGRFIQPVRPNQQSLDLRILQHYGDQIELERGHTLLGDDRPGRVRVLAFRSRAVMTRYADALALAARTGGVPSLDAARGGAQVKYGVGLNVEQAVSANVGLFARASWADGGTETYAFTEIDRSVSAGALIKGGAWQRADDTLGIGWARNSLSRPHRQFLAAGGMGFFLGDGKLNYRPEQVLELFYHLRLHKYLDVALNWQHIRHPGYNADRGPVNFYALRLHASF
ncbi:carbohydrate porin [Ottowia sp.]|uniref:carbohydrate porin n=1 Tax=Ottowia sp. TaxID=1898956 RepID=UPI002C148A64|nr:carbohydrate porin [Ottowia sp.]HOB67355.1 carbohydrate porin [Ottowia sp.]HPZ55733.1 carbohydrate porin [Ottowia sp.]HQD46350.1 carbohydrate porin [Ottowia sp.]